jgi:hypothetical protein
MSDINPADQGLAPEKKKPKKNSPKASEQGKRPAADLIVDLALSTHRFGVTEKEEPFAVALNGPNVALLLKEYADDLRDRLAAEYRRKHKTVASQAALANAINVLRGEAQSGPVEEVHLRVAWHHGNIVIDIGDKTGRAVVVGPGIGWTLEDRSPVLFRRTALTAPLPIPVSGGHLHDLRRLINVSNKDWPVLIGWLLAAFIPDIPHPLLFLSGTQGTGKSWFAEMLLGLIDPSSVPRGHLPRDPDRWHETAQNRWGMILDNVSMISAELSDLLCKAVTGDASIRRRLYTNSDVVVRAIRNVVILTSIDAGVLRGDLGERLFRLELDPIPSGNRLDEKQLHDLKVQLFPGIFGALLDALVETLGSLPTVDPPSLPRMADFGKVLAAADEAGMTVGALRAFLHHQQEISQDVLDGDSFGVAVKELALDRSWWAGTATDLLDELWPGHKGLRPKDWPKPNGVKGRLKRLIPQFKNDGIDIVFEKGTGKERKRLIRISVTDEPELAPLPDFDAEVETDTDAEGDVDAEVEVDEWNADQFDDGDPSPPPEDDEIPF